MVITRNRSSSGVASALWRFVVDETLLSIFVLSALAVLWAVAAPRWLESLLQRAAAKAAFASLVFAGIIWWMHEYAQNR